MKHFFDPSVLSVIMPILAAVIVLVIVVVFIVNNNKTKQIQSLALSQKYYEELTRELTADHAAMKAELADIRETVHSIDKMMKEIQ